MRFLIDENLPRGVAQVLVRLGHDVLDVASSPHRGESDLTLWQLAVSEDRLLVTRDLDFPLPGTSGRPPGVVLVRVGGLRTGDLVRLFEEAVSRVSEASLVGNVTVIEPGRVRQRPYALLPR